MLFPTTLVGSYPQPEWLIDRARLAGRFPPRVRARELWRVPEPYLPEAQDDATMLAIRAQEDAGLDIVTDGEIRRESYSNLFATALDGVDLDNPGTALDRSGHPNPVPRVVGDDPAPPRGRRAGLEFLRATYRSAGQGDGAGSVHHGAAGADRLLRRQPRAGRHGLRRGRERRDPRSVRAGADVVQIDEPYMQARPEEARAFGLRALNRALEGVDGTTAVHICFGYAAIIHVRPSGYSFLPELARLPLCAGVDRDCAVESRLCGAQDAARQEDHPRCASTSRTTQSRRPSWWRAASGAPCHSSIRGDCWSRRIAA